MAILDETSELEEAYSKARLNLINFRAILLQNDEEKDVEAAWFHFRWSDILLHGTKNFVVEAFRESAKTQYVIRSFPLYCLTFPEKKRSYIVIVKNNERGAWSKLKEITREYLSNPLLCANLVQVHEQSGSVFSCTVKNEDGDLVNIRIEAYGKGASIRGISYLDKRPDILIMDDPQDLKDSKSDTVLTGDWEWFAAEIKLIGKHTRIFMIGNNLGEKCIVERAINNAILFDFEWDRVPAMKPETDQPNARIVSTWPAWNKVEDLEAEREKYRQSGDIELWMREKMCLAVSDETRIFLQEDLRFYAPLTAERIRSECNVCACLDPASSVKESADYRAMVVTGVNADNHWFALDCSYGLYDTTKMIDEMFRLVTYWKFQDFGIEEGALKAALQPFILAEMAKRNIFFNIIPLKAKQKKEERIILLQPRVKAHTIWLPDKAPWVAELTAEMLGFTRSGAKTLRDDVLDAFAYTEQIARAPFGRGAKKNLPREAMPETKAF